MPVRPYLSSEKALYAPLAELEHAKLDSVTAASGASAKAVTLEECEHEHILQAQRAKPSIAPSWSMPESQGQQPVPFLPLFLNGQRSVVFREGRSLAGITRS